MITGYCAWDYTPTRRGFDSFLGFYLGSQNHFSHDRDYKSFPDDPPAFYDFRNNEQVADKDKYQGVYSTIAFKQRSVDIIKHVADKRDLNAYANYDPFFLYLAFQATHAPLQARAEMLAKVPQTTNPARDIYKAMVMDMDLAIGDIVQSLKDTGLYNDTIIVITSDNGGAISHGASNYPLRGTKGTLFEGGTRVPTLVHGPAHILPRQGVVSNTLVHITDWMPTIMKLAGYQGDPAVDMGLDGVDQVPALVSDHNVRQDMVYNLKSDPISGAFRQGPYKIIFGKKFNKQGWYDVDNTALQCNRLFKKERKKISGEDGTVGKKHKKKHLTRNSKKIELETSRQIAKSVKTLMPDTPIKRKGGKKSNQRKKSGKKDIKKANKRTKNKKARNKKIKNEKLKKKRERRKKQKLKAKKKKNRKVQKKSRSDLTREDKIALREDKRSQRRDEKKEKKLNKIWKDWLPHPSEEIQNMLRLRMDDCNWEDFSDSGHTEDLHLIPRSSFSFGDMVQIIDPMLNPFNISADDEENEFDDLDRSLSSDDKLEKMFNKVDFAMYNVIEDPEERNDLKQELPEIFQELKRKTLEHLKNIVPEDFPAQDYSGHPRNFDGYFSPGWCRPK